MRTSGKSSEIFLHGAVEEGSNTDLLRILITNTINSMEFRNEHFSIHWVFTATSWGGEGCLNFTEC